MRRRDGRKKKAFIFLSFVIILVCVFIFFKLFTIKEIIFSREPKCIEKEKIKPAVTDLIGRNILTFDENFTEKDILENTYCIGRIIINKKLPSSLLIEAYDREPALVLNQVKIATDDADLNVEKLLISTDSSKLNALRAFFSYDKKIIVDTEGFTLDPKNFHQILPEVTYIGKQLKLNQSLGTYLINARILIHGLNLSKTEVNNLVIINDKILIAQGKTQLIFSLTKDPNRQLTTLQIILQKAKISGAESSSKNNLKKEIVKIDLRYDKPIVVFSI